MLGKGDQRLTFVVGAILSNPGVAYLDALDHIHKLNPGTVATVLLVLVVAVVQQLLLEVPLLSYVFTPDRTEDTVNQFNAWMERSGRPAAVIGAGLIGVWLAREGHDQTPVSSASRAEAASTHHVAQLVALSSTGDEGWAQPIGAGGPAAAHNASVRANATAMSTSSHQ